VPRRHRPRFQNPSQPVQKFTRSLYEILPYLGTTSNLSQTKRGVAIHSPLSCPRDRVARYSPAKIVTRVRIPPGALTSLYRIPEL
jgi:hypothetical protein